MIEPYALGEPLSRSMVLDFDADPRTLRAIRTFVHSLVLSYGGTEEDAFALEIAAGEVLHNTYEHAYARRSGPVEINLLYDEAKIEFTIHNHGEPITETPVIPSTPPSGGRGRGLYLVGQLTDESEVIQAADGRRGVGIRLAKYLRRD